MANQHLPHEAQRNSERPRAADGSARSDAPDSPERRADGPGRKIGLNSEAQPDLVTPSVAHERDRSAAGETPVGGGALNFDDGTDMVHPRGKVTEAGRSWNEKNPSDAGDLGAPNPGLSDRNEPSDPDAKRSS